MIKSEKNSRIEQYKGKTSLVTIWKPSVCLLSSLSQTAEVYNNFAYFFAYLFMLCSCICIKIQGTGVFNLDNALKHCLSFAWNLSDYQIPVQLVTSVEDTPSSKIEVFLSLPCWLSQPTEPSEILNLKSLNTNETTCHCSALWSQNLVRPLYVHYTQRPDHYTYQVSVYLSSISILTKYQYTDNYT